MDKKLCDLPTLSITYRGVFELLTSEENLKSYGDCDDGVECIEVVWASIIAEFAFQHTNAHGVLNISIKQFMELFPMYALTSLNNTHFMFEIASCLGWGTTEEYEDEVNDFFDNAPFEICQVPKLRVQTFVELQCRLASFERVFNRTVVILKRWKEHGKYAGQPIPSKQDVQKLFDMIRIATDQAGAMEN